MDTEEIRREFDQLRIDSEKMNLDLQRVVGVTERVSWLSLKCMACIFLLNLKGKFRGRGGGGFGGVLCIGGSIYLLIMLR